MRMRHGRPALGLAWSVLVFPLCSASLSPLGCGIAEVHRDAGQLFEMIGLDSCPFPTWSLSCSGIVRHITGTKGLLRKQVRNL